jgi:ubiquinone/menaquinone biosynthesis C-methylase UbiE
LDKDAKTLLDVGCGNDYFLKKAHKAGYEIHGCDVLLDVNVENGTFHVGNIEHLPFADKQFDIVTSHHTLEHVVNLNKAISELKRVARKQVEVTLPCQRYFKYTLDEHINFITSKSQLVHLMGLKKYKCENIGGDWVYIGYLQE